MKFTLQEKDVVYNPKTGEYTVDVPLEFLGHIFCYPILIKGPLTEESRKMIENYLKFGSIR